ncbi:MAG: glycosyltransferase family 9 protein [Verrucomicrobiota bacterium]
MHKIRFLVYVLFLRLRRWKRVIVLERTSGLGDVLCCLPTYRTLKLKYPAHLIVFATAKPYDQLLKCCGEIDAVYGAPPGQPFPQEKAAWLVDRHYEPHTSDERKQGGQKLHLAHVFLKDCGLPLMNWQPRLSLPVKDQKAVMEQLGLPTDKMFIAIHTGRTWPVKELPETTWQKVVNTLRNIPECEIIHFCSPCREGAPVHQLDGVRRMSPDSSLMQIAAVLSQSKLFIGIDSGLLHLAGALGIPVVGVFGPTNPDYFLPFTPLTRGVCQTLPCSFCHHETPIKHWSSGCPHDIRCMKEISAAQLVEAAKSVLSQAAT